MSTYSQRAVAFLTVGLVVAACGSLPPDEPPLLEFDEVPVTQAVEALPDPTIEAATAVPTTQPVPQGSDAAQPPAEGQPIRIQFDAGAVSATLQGDVEANGVDEYVLYALAGQQMTVSIDSPANDVFLSIAGLADGQPLVRAATGATSWTGRLVASQDYAIKAVAGGNFSVYTIEVVILPLDQSQEETGDDIYEQAQQAAINRVAFQNALLHTLSTTPRDYDAMRALMGDSFAISGWGAQGREWSPDEAVVWLQSTYLPPDAVITYALDEDINALLGTDPFQLFPEAGLFVFSQGWGEDGQTEVILVMAQTGPAEFVWDGILVAPDGF